VSKKLRDTTVQAIAPIGRNFVHQNTNVLNFFQNISQIPSLRQDRQQLQQQVIELQQKVAEQETIRRENEALRNEVGVTGISRDSKKLLGRIIVRGTDPLDHTFTVDVGSNQGVKENQPAVSGGFLIGKVIEVRSNSAIVREINSKNSVVQAWISENREKGALIGDGNSVLLTEITQGVEVKSESIIETSGLGGTLPQGILIGQIGAIRSKESDSSQKFLVKIMQDSANLESVLILLTDTP